MRPPPRAWRRAASLSVSEAGRVLRVGRSRAYSLANEGRLPTYTDSLGRLRVNPVELERLLVAGEPDLFGEGGES